MLNGDRSLGKQEFTNTDAYTLAGHLERLHPDNRHVRDKIRQQLQVLRDAKLLCAFHPASAVILLGVPRSRGPAEVGTPNKHTSTFPLL